MITIASVNYNWTNINYGETCKRKVNIKVFFLKYKIFNTYRIKGNKLNLNKPF